MINHPHGELYFPRSAALTHQSVATTLRTIPNTRHEPTTPASKSLRSIHQTKSYRVTTLSYQIMTFIDFPSSSGLPTPSRPPPAVLDSVRICKLVVFGRLFEGKRKLDSVWQLSVFSTELGTRCVGDISLTLFS